MPIFEYTCQACGKPFDKLVFSAREIKCPDCSSGNVEKHFSAFAVSKSSSDDHPSCGTAECGFNRGSCGSGLCGHGH